VYTKYTIIYTGYFTSPLKCSNTCNIITGLDVHCTQGRVSELVQVQTCVQQLYNLIVTHMWHNPAVCMCEMKCLTGELYTCTVHWFLRGRGARSTYNCTATAEQSTEPAVKTGSIH